MHKPNLMVKHTGLLLVLLLNFAGAWARNKPDADTTKIFSLEDLRVMVFRYHPIIKQAALFTETAKANVLQSLGYFDPAIKANFGRKVFGDTEYYNRWDSELKVPLWVAGADLKIGYDRNVGTYTNPETRTMADGLTGVGINIPIGQGFLIDSRRSTLRQAKIMVQYTEAERVKQVNGTWYDIVKDYWAWYYSYRQFVLSQEGVELALRRFKAVNTQTRLGDKASIDSVEAYITVQERIVQLDKNRVELQNSRLVLSNHLWNEKGNPLELPEGAVPQRVVVDIEKPDRLVLDTLVQQIASQHPELLKLRAKGSQLAIERSYRREMLKPKVNLSGTLLSSRRDFNSYVPDYYDFKWSNYKVGIEFAFPLFLRAERGKLKEVALKQQQLDYDIQQSGREIKNNVLSAYNNIIAYEAQVKVQAQSVKNQETLLKGEMQKFELGESTLFLINSRETKLIDMRTKLESMIAGYQKSLAELYYKAGSRQPI